MRYRPHHRRASGSSNVGYSITSGSSVNQNGATSTLLISTRAQESPTTLLGRIGDADGPPLLGPSISWRFAHNRSSVPLGRIMPSSVRSSFLLVLVTLLNMSSLAVGLVIEKPYQENFEHVPASFGPDPLQLDPPIESLPLVEAQPRQACAPLQNSFNGAIALVERGTCDFTEKVFRAQEAGASAVVVVDSKPRVIWNVVMRGTAESSQGIDIPAVLVSYETGEHLWSTRSWMPRRKFRASINAIGHIANRTPQIGTTLEMLGIYFLLSVLLLAFSGVCGLLFAIGLSWYQRGYRTRALRRLKTFVFSLRNRPRSATGTGNAATAVVGKVANGEGTADASAEPSPAQIASERGALASQGVDSTRGNGGMGCASGEYNNGMRADDDTCAICLDAYEEGDSLTALPCHHSFHTHCIRPWLSGKSALCPLCKKEAFTRGRLFGGTPPRLEALFAELAALCTENLVILGLFFLASVAFGVIAAKISVLG